MCKFITNRNINQIKRKKIITKLCFLAEKRKSRAQCTALSCYFENNLLSESYLTNLDVVTPLSVVARMM
jgi:hypothetical protein